MDENILMLCYTTYKYKIYITKQVNKNYKKETYQANKPVNPCQAKRTEPKSV